MTLAAIAAQPTGTWRVALALCAHARSAGKLSTEIMATDYDTPRTTDTATEDDHSLETLKARRAQTTADLGDDTDPLEAEFDLPGADLPGEDLVIRVLPAQVDEFTCTSCYLVQHRSQLADQGRGVCRECTA